MVQRIMRHSDIKLTDRYTRFRVADFDAAAMLIPSLKPEVKKPEALQATGTDASHYESATQADVDNTYVANSASSLRHNDVDLTLAPKHIHADVVPMTNDVQIDAKSGTSQIRDPEPGREAVVRGGLGSRLRTDGHLRQAEYGPL
jgi:hypothetical protein